MSKTVRRLLQLLPAIVAAVAAFVYALSFWPFSAGGMAGSVALVECRSHYRLMSGGREVAWFVALGDSLQPEGMVLPGDSSAVATACVNGVWVDRYAFVPSCRGLMVAANADSAAAERVDAANGGILGVLAVKAGRMENELEMIDRAIDDADYYMRVHNAIDDGYNVMAARAQQLKARRAAVEKMLAVVSAAAAGRLPVIERVTEYTLLYSDTADVVSRKECSVLTADMSSGLLLLQTTDRSMPSGAEAVGMHQWLVPSTAPGDSLFVASVAGCGMAGYTPQPSSAAVYGARAGRRQATDLPPVLTPDGAPVFSRNGQFEGIMLNRRLVRPAEVGFGLKNLLP